MVFYCLFVPFFVNRNNVTFPIQKEKHQLQYIDWDSFPEFDKWRNHILLTCEYRYYNNFPHYFNLSFYDFILRERCRRQTIVIQISNSRLEFAIVYYRALCCKMRIKKFHFFLRSFTNLFWWNEGRIRDEFFYTLEVLLYISKFFCHLHIILFWPMVFTLITVGPQTSAAL